MDEFNSPKPEKREQGDWKTLLTLCALPPSGAIFLVTLGFLTRGPFLTGLSLYATYFAYAVSLIVFLHAAFFFRARVLKDRGKTLDKRVPKYLEYAYAVVISLSLAQIFFLAPRLADYLVFVTGDNEILLNRIRAQAQKHIRDDCGKFGQYYFTLAYCTKIKEIADAQDLNALLFSSVVDDDAFLHHAIGRKFVPAPPGSAWVDEYSPILPDILNLQALKIYKTQKLESSGK